MFDAPHQTHDTFEPDGFSAEATPASEAVGAMTFGAATKPRVSPTTLAMAGMFVAGVGILLALSSAAGPQSASASDAELARRVDSFLDHSAAGAGQARANEGTEMIASFYHYSSRRQIPVDELKTNPFAVGLGPAAVDHDGEAPAVVTVANAHRRKELQRQFERMTLNGIMMTANGAAAIIDGAFVNKGSRVGDFVVTDIARQGVELTCEQMTFMLMLER